MWGHLLNDPRPAGTWTQSPGPLFKPGSLKASNSREELTFFPMALVET